MKTKINVSVSLFFLFFLAIQDNYILQSPYNEQQHGN